jgi:hypothetical protein
MIVLSLLFALILIERSENFQCRKLLLWALHLPLRALKVDLHPGI